MNDEERSQLYDRIHDLERKVEELQKRLEQYKQDYWKIRNELQHALSHD